MSVVHDIKETQLRKLTGNYTTKTLTNQLKKKRTKLHSLLLELADIEVMGRDEAPRPLPLDEKRKMLETGEAPMGWTSDAGERSYGKEIHRLRADVQRCKE